MSDRSAIEWTDATWNPVTGCTKVSPGCDHCYAETLAERFRGTPGHYFERGFDVQLRPDKLDQPLRWKKPRRIFVNSMSDLFHEAVPDEFIAQVFAVMAAAPQHTFQILTKRHARMRAWVKRVTECEHGWRTHDGTNPAGAYEGTGVVIPGDVWPLPNVWLGVSVENQRWADTRIPALLDTPAAVRFLSCEPLLGPVNAQPYFWSGDDNGPLPGVDWVIVGGESGRGARPMHPDWARQLRDQCTAAGVAFHFKQWGEWQVGSLDPRTQRGEDHVVVLDGRHEPFAGHGDEPLSDLARARLRDEPGTEHPVVMSRVGKKAAGRELDGRTWDEEPAR